MSKAPLIIAGVAVLAVAGYMMYSKEQMMNSPEALQASREWEFASCMRDKELMPDQCVEYVMQKEKAMEKLNVR